MRHDSYLKLGMVILLLAACSVPVSTTLAGDEAPGRVTVSGISAGGYAAVQVHVALADAVSGAAVIAGGPYHCAEGNLAHALGRCISGEELDTAPLADGARAAAADGAIAPVESLSDDRVWLFHGLADPIVNVAVTRGLREFYAAFVPDEAMTLVDDVAVTHGWPTVDRGHPCGEMGGDYINACDYDAAGAMLQHLYGPLEPPTKAIEANLRPMDQAAIATEGSSLADSGYAYVPESCASNPGECRLHLSFHGCRQGKEFIGDSFARQAGFNEWAESNNIVVLYPQVSKSMMNPQGCWDWWGYTGADYDRRDGKQIAGIAALIAAWSGQDD